MARIYPLFSSSRGNCVYVGNTSEGVLIDAGVSYKRLRQGLETCGLDISAVKAVFVTHDHSDHIAGLKVLTNKHDIPVYALPATLKKLVQSDAVNSDGREIDGDIDIAEMKITYFRTPHDTEESCGYRICTSDGKTCAVCTDLGHVTDEVQEGISGCDLVMIEANYDDKMLKNGPYPFYLKQRISSVNGHLSNRDCADEVKKLVENGTMRIILGHLSQENNTPSTALAAVAGGLSEYTRNKDYILEVAPVETTGNCMVF